MQRQIRAVHDADTIRVYQAYSDAIADAALAAGTFVAPFSMNRMTWVKPSFMWTMYRSGWGGKDPNQARILAVDLDVGGFEWALRHACPTTPEPGIDLATWKRLKETSPCRVQWDPERDLDLLPTGVRTLQLGIGGEAVALYVGEWIHGIADVTDLAHRVRDLVAEGRRNEALGLLPVERPWSPGLRGAAPQDAAEKNTAAPIVNPMS